VGDFLKALESIPSESLTRPTQIHRHCCKHCPSAPHREHDPESLAYAAADYETRVDAVFRCAWRPEKACKGNADLLRITEQDLRARAECTAEGGRSR